jgi:hypothetical protein
MDNAIAHDKEAQQVLYFLRNFRLKVSAYVNKVFYSPTDAQVTVLTTILKFTLKQLRYISVQSNHLQ